VGRPYRESLEPLSDEALLEQWRGLSAVDITDPQLPARLAPLLSASLPDPLADRTDAPPLPVEQASVLFRPTASNPRAYQGTKDRPPKSARPTRHDLRPYLGVMSAENRLLGQSPYALIWSEPTAQRIKALPPLFRRHLLWSLRGADWDLIGRLLAVYWGLSLETDGALLSCVSRLLALGQSQLGWCETLIRLRSDRRISLVELLIETARGCSPHARLSDALVQCSESAADEVWRHRASHLLKQWRAGGSIEAMLEGFALANAHRVDHRFTGLGVTVGAATAIEAVSPHLGELNAMYLWETATRFVELPELLGRVRWQRLDLQSASELGWLLVNFQYCDSEGEALQRRWRAFVAAFDALFSLLCATTLDYRPKALRHLKTLIWHHDDAATLTEKLLRYLLFLERLCTPPFAKQGRDDEPFTRLLQLRPDCWQRLIAVEDEILLRIERASVRENDAWMIGEGCWTLAERLPAFTAGAIEHEIGPLIKAAKALAGLSPPMRKLLLERFAVHEVMREGLTPEQMVRLVDRLGELDLHSPVPRRLRDPDLTAGQRARHQARLVDRWPGFQLNVLRCLAFAELRAGLTDEVRGAATRHALMIQSFAQENRRALRRLLRSSFRGELQYAETHPLNQAWLAAHPAIDPAIWLSQMARQVGGVRLAFERDPLEVLRLGSYFGTCLGLGGRLAYSAAAIALDVNKQVVFARDVTGRHVARQLLAITEADTLICFQVYPEPGAAMGAVFSDHDQWVSAQLGIPLHDPQSDDYEVQLSLAQGYYDDIPWIPETGAI